MVLGDVVFLNLILSFKYTFAINVAAGMNSMFCNIKQLSNRLTDGNKDIFQGEIITAKCHKNAFIDIDLIKDYYVHYVVVYQGIGTDLHDGQLDYFSVKEFISGVLKNCSEYPGPSAGEGVAMVVNCQPQPPSNKVRIESKKDEGLFLSEVEVHTLGLGLDDGNGLTYRGCFRNFTGDRHVGFDLIQCQKICSAAFRYIAIKNGKECFCGDSYSKLAEIHPNKCDLTCGISQRRCGGTNSYSLYIANVRLPHYIGCYEGIAYKMHLIIQLNTETINIAHCLQFCEDYHFALLWLGYTCGCANDQLWDETDIKKGVCHSKCSSDVTKVCGGQNSASVYKTCYDETSMPFKCSELFRCSGEWDENGICKSICKQGFTGPHCLERDFYEVIYATMGDFICVNILNESECLCPPGYFLSTNETCTSHFFYATELMKKYEIYIMIFIGIMTIVIALALYYTKKDEDETTLSSESS